MGILDTLRGGVPIVFCGGSREVAEMIDYEKREFIINNRIVTKARLYVNFAEKFKGKQTGWWFDPYKDFDPPLPDRTSTNQIPWEDLGMTVILCYKSFNGQFNWKDTTLDSYQIKVKTLNDYILNLKRNAINLLRQLEKLKDPNVQIEENFYLADQLSALQRLLQRVPEDEEGKTKDVSLSKIFKE